MWLMELLPDWVFYTTLMFSVISLVGASVLNLRSVQLIAVVLACISIFYIGGIETQHVWQARVTEMQARVDLAEQKSLETNTKIVTQTVTKIKLVKDTTNANQQYIKTVVAKDLDSECKLTIASILLHNSASQNEVSTSTSNITGTTTEVKASELLTTVTENYGTYYEVVERLKGWQVWYYQQKAIFEQVK